MFCLGNGLSRPQMQLILFLGVMEKLCQKSSLGSHPSLPEPHFSGHLWTYLIQRRGIKKWEGKRSRLHQRPTPGEQKVCFLTIPIPITRPWRPFLLFKSKSIFSKPYMKTESESGSVVTLCDPMDYTIHGILLARILEWVASAFSRVQYLGAFPGGSVVKNPPANAGYMGSIPDSGRSHKPRSN